MSSWYTEDMSELHIKLPTNVDTIVDSCLDFVGRTGAKNKDLIFCMSESALYKLRGFRLANSEYLSCVINGNWYVAGIRVHFFTLSEEGDDIVLTTKKAAIKKLLGYWK